MSPSGPFKLITRRAEGRSVKRTGTPFLEEAVIFLVQGPDQPGAIRIKGILGLLDEGITDLKIKT